MKRTGFLLGAILTAFLFSSYQYFAAKRALRFEVERDLSQVESTVAMLADLERSRLETIARSLAQGPMLRGALQSGHGPTITSVLEDIHKSNNLGSLTVDFRGQRFSAFAPDASELSGEYAGRMGAEEFKVRIGAALDGELLRSWKARSGAELSWKDRATLAANSWLRSEEGGLGLLAGPQDQVYFFRPLQIRPEGVTAYLARAPYVERFRAERNRLLFFALLVTAALSLASVGASRWISRGEGGVSRAEWERLIAEIEAIKRGKT